uniref:Uncharacterized protein n=1 Tax=Timema genevievae TaxID=629358 RepID=A0A7R9JU37_TIMGE|nr:unnamed protein product [Timema genevievae]
MTLSYKLYHSGIMQDFCISESCALNNIVYVCMRILSTLQFGSAMKLQLIVVETGERWRRALLRNIAIVDVLSTNMTANMSCFDKNRLVRLLIVVQQLLKFHIFHGTDQLLGCDKLLALAPAPYLGRITWARLRPQTWGGESQTRDTVFPQVRFLVASRG